MKQKICSLLCMTIIFVVVLGVAVEARYYDDEEHEPSPCWHCYGSGRCPTCDGSGEKIVEEWVPEFMEDGEIYGSHYEEHSITCDECYGTGQCQCCYGSGVM